MQLNKFEKNVVIHNSHFTLKAILGIPDYAKGLVIFAHGSGSGRLSTRNHFVARELQKAGLATLLMDLLTMDEEADRRNVFDIELLAKRLIFAKNWARRQANLKSMPIGYFGASTGAGAALMASALDRDEIFAVVSRGGRPDLAGSTLKNVTSPTLLIVGGKDFEVMELNSEAKDQLRCKKELKIVEGATHLFEEPGTLEKAAALATKWFLENLPASIRKPSGIQL